MYDELIKRLRDAAKMSEALSVLLPHSDGNAVAKLQREAADAIEELSRENESLAKSVNEASEILRKRWIPVTETPPRKVGDDGYNGYLVYANGYYEVADYTTDKLGNVLCFHVNGEYEPDVTHFMPLPEPPKEEI